MEMLNKATLGAKKVQGSRAGRQRYATEIQTGIISAEESAGIQRLADLDAQEQRLINEANRAASAKDFELLNMRYNAIMDIQNQKEQTLLNLRQMAQEEEDRLMNKIRFDREKETWAKEDAGVRLESMLTGGISLDNLSDDEYNKLETDLGLMEGTLDGFYTGLQDAQAAQAVGDSIKLQKSVIDLLNATPEGMEVTIGDSTYTGLKDMTDRYMFTEIIGNTKYQVAVDKKTGEELWRKSAGQAYKPTVKKITPTEGSKIFSSQATKNRLLGIGFSIEEIDVMGEEIATNGLQSVIDMLKPEDYSESSIANMIPNWSNKVKLLESIMSGETATQANNNKGGTRDIIFTSSYLESNYPEDDMEENKNIVRTMLANGESDTAIRTTLDSRY